MGSARLLALGDTRPSEGEFGLMCHKYGMSYLIIAGRYGFTSRQWGLTLDNVIGATVVLADGTIVNASSTEQPDLFWVGHFSRSDTGCKSDVLLRLFAEQPRPLVSSPITTFRRT